MVTHDRGRGRVGTSRDSDSPTPDTGINMKLTFHFLANTYLLMI